MWSGEQCLREIYCLCLQETVWSEVLYLLRTVSIPDVLVPVWEYTILVLWIGFWLFVSTERAQPHAPSSPKCHFRYLIIPPTVSTEVTLSRMTAALGAILVERLQNLRAKMAASLRVIRDSVISVVTVGWTEDDVTELTRSKRQLRWRKVLHFLLIQITKTYSNLSPCC